MYHIKQNNKTPLHIQLFEQVKEDILNNYEINEKLPSIRKIATMYNLSKNTVEAAYSQLVVEGYIDSIPKSGYVVIQNSFTDFRKDFNNKVACSQKEDEILYDFFPARLQKDNFPLKLWKRLSNKAINESLDFGMYSNRQGEYDLRVQLSKYLNKSRAVKCEAEQIILGNGLVSSLSLLALILKDSHRSFGIEEPGYHVARKVFQSHGYKINRIDVTKTGIDIDKVKSSKSKLVYVTPSHQYPTGVVIPIAKRLKLLDWAEENDTYIIEDDYDTELTYENRPIPSLQGLDNKQRVVYIGTFSKALSPALRVSYMILPKPLLEIYKQTFSYYDAGVSLTTQKTLTSFIEEGYWDKHLRKTRTQNKKKHNLLKSLLISKLKNTMEIVSQGGGLAILIRPTIKLDLKLLEKLAKEEKIKIYFARPRAGGNFEALMMGFGGIKEEELEKAINTFSKIWFKCLDS